MKRKLAALDLPEPPPPEADEKLPESKSAKKDAENAGPLTQSIKRRASYHGSSTDTLRQCPTGDPVISATLVLHRAMRPSHRSRNVKSPTTRPGRRRAIWQWALAQKRSLSGFAPIMQDMGSEIQLSAWQVFFSASGRCTQKATCLHRRTAEVSGSCATKCSVSMQRNAVQGWLHCTCTGRSPGPTHSA